MHATRFPINLEDIQAWAAEPGCGAIALFLGIVRAHSDGRTGVTAITYEAYESTLQKSLDLVASHVLNAFPSVRRLAIWHRIGRVELGEPSLVIAAATAHRREAFAACEFAVDSVKASLPIWKFEHSTEGDGWAVTHQPIVDLSHERS